MRRPWIRCLALIALGMSGCQNTIDQRARVISGPPATALQGVVSAPLAVPLAAQSLTAGYKPASGIPVQVLLLDGNGNVLARLSTTTGPDGTYRVVAPLFSDAIFGKSTILVLVDLGGGVKLGLISPLTANGSAQADVDPGTSVLAFSELGATTGSSDAQAAFTSFFQSQDKGTAGKLGQVNSGNSDLLVQFRGLADILAGLKALRDAADGASFSSAEGGAARAIGDGLSALLNTAAAKGAQANAALLRAALTEELSQLRSALAGVPPSDLAGLLAAIGRANAAALRNIDQIIVNSGQARPTPSPTPTPQPFPTPSQSAVSGVSGSSGVAGGSSNGSQSAGGGI